MEPVSAVGTMGASMVIPIIIWGTLGLFVYFIPYLVAHKKQHIQKTPILLLNIFLGWTFIGWVIALIWAVMENKNSNNLR